MNKNNKNIILLIVCLTMMISSCNVLNSYEKTIIADENKFKFEYSFAEAGKQRMKGNDKEAIDTYMYCLEINPKSAASNYFISTIYANDGDFSTALTFADNAVKLNDKKIWYKILFADMLVEQNIYQEAENIYKQIIQSNPEMKSIYYDLINIYMEQKKTEQALNVYKKLQTVFAYEETNALPVYNLLMTLNKKDEALEELRKLRRYFPENIKFKALIAEYYLAVNEMDKAKKMYKEMLAEEPNNISFRLSYASYSKFLGDGDMFYENAIIIINSYDVDFKTKIRLIISRDKNLLSEEQYENLLENLMLTNPNERITYTLYAEYLLEKDKKNKAAKYIRKAVNIDNSNFNLVLVLFEIDYEIGDFKNLYNDTEKLKDIYPNQSKVFFYNALALYNLKDYKNAEKTLSYGKDLVIDDNNLMSKYLFYLAEVYNKQNKYEKADLSFEKALNLKKDYWEAANSYAYYLSEKNIKPERAEELALACIKSDKDSPTYNNTYALVLYKQEKYEDALKYIEVAIENIKTENHKLIELYGDILFKNNKTEDAVIQWKKAYKLNKLSKKLELKIKNKKL